MVSRRYKRDLSTHKRDPSTCKRDPCTRRTDRPIYSQKRPIMYTSNTHQSSMVSRKYNADEESLQEALLPEVASRAISPLRRPSDTPSLRYTVCLYMYFCICI